MSEEREWDLPQALQAVLPHLNELRRRLMVAVLALAAGAGLAFVIAPHILAFLAVPIGGLEELQAMDPGDFEVWVRQLFRSRGYFVENTPDSRDHGIDLWIVSPQGERAIVQCKRYRGVVGESVVRGRRPGPKACGCSGSVPRFSS